MVYLISASFLLSYNEAHITLFRVRWGITDTYVVFPKTYDTSPGIAPVNCFRSLCIFVFFIRPLCTLIPKKRITIFFIGFSKYFRKFPPCHAVHTMMHGKAPTPLQLFFMSQGIKKVSCTLQLNILHE